MFLNRRMFTAVAVCLCLSASTAFAGGNGGTKKDATIKVTNNSATVTQLGVAVDPSAALLAATTAEQFVNRGGKSIGAGGTAVIPVKAGTHRVIVVNLATGAPLGDQNVTVGKGNVLAGTYTDAGGLKF
jgi:hypothetical protein